MFAGCTNLDEEVYSVVSKDAFFASETLLSIYSARAYTTLQAWGSEQSMWTMNLQLGNEVTVPMNSVGEWKQDRYKQLQTHKVQINNELIERSWEYCFNGIAACNDIISEIEKRAKDFEGKDRVLAEMHLIRAFYYFLAIDCWGNIPYSVSNEEKGYPEQMNIAIHTVPTDEFSLGDGQHYTVRNDHMFDTEKLLPYLNEEHEPSVFYFVPMHFSDIRFGYSVLQCALGQKRKTAAVFHNWIRNVGNALEMIRSKNRLTILANRDEMTGLFNRRGMEHELGKIDMSSQTDEWLVYVVDMDGLKYINDTFGHPEGDFALKTVSAAIMSIARLDDICVRAGGDEFYIVGAGPYDEEQCRRRYDDFLKNLDNMSRNAGKPYPVLASIGFAHGPLSRDIDDVLSEADVKMYESKLEMKHYRG